MTDVERTAARLDVVRSLPLRDVRSEDNGDGLTFTGYAAVWDAPTLIDSWEGRFREQIKRGAFRKSLSERTPVLQFDHGSHPLIGSIPIGVITDAREDERGVMIEARLHSGDFFAPVREAIASGSINGMSFRFEVVRDAWRHDTDDGISERTLVELRIPEVGPVVFPAYAETEAAVRYRATRYAQAVAHLVEGDRSGEPAPEPATATPTEAETEPPAETPDSAPTPEGHPDEDSTTDAPTVPGHPSRITDAHAEMRSLLDHPRDFGRNDNA